MQEILYALHVLAAIAWVGGMFFAHMALRPAVGILEPPQRLRLWASILDRFFAWVWGAVIILLASGTIIILDTWEGMARAPLPVHLMTGIGLLMAAIFATIFFVPYRTFRTKVAAEDWPGAAAAQATIRRLVAINLVLGLAVSAIGASGRFWN